MTDDHDLHRRAQELDETPAGDHALIVSIAGLNAIPVVGGVLATFISEYVPRQKQQRLVSFAQDLLTALEEEKERVDSDFVRSAEFAELVEDVLDSVQQRRNEEKHRYYAALVAGSASETRPEQEERDRLVDALDRVRMPHLRLLHVIATTTEPPPDLWAGGVAYVIHRQMDIGDAELREQWADLAAVGLVGPYPAGTMTAAGAGNLRARLTEFGRRFVSFLHVERDVVEG